ncbi:MAG: hypothetical protein NC355_07185 [Blautia sp.]|nr:hypothetical protein [Blautia sp.]
MRNKLPKLSDKHKICIICEGSEEYEYIKRLRTLKVWSEQYDISLVNAGGNGNIPSRYQDRYQNVPTRLYLYSAIRKGSLMSSMKILSGKSMNFMV